MFVGVRRAGDGADGPKLGGIFVDEFNLNPILQVITWLLLALCTLMVGFRLLTKFYIKSSRALLLEDIFILSAYLFGLGESITMLTPPSTIFGTDKAGLSEDDISAGLKAGYARDLLFLLCLGFSKLSVYESMRALSPNRSHLRWAHVVGAFVVIWAVTSFLGTAFQCGIHGPWDRSSTVCFNQDAFLRYVYSISILTDAILIAFPIAIIYPLHMALMLRLAIIAFCSFRILVIAASIAQLVYLPTLSADNFTLEAFPYYLSMQLALFASIFAACIMYFWPFMRSLESGMMSAHTATFTSQYPLTRYYKSKSDKGQSSRATASSDGRSRRDYIEIRTDIAVIPGGQPKAPLPAAKIYNWD
ncbi:hypothetical protein GGS26DRAFT_589485 [Hypomontagnella submonticulosa]|nr:hypothetical protein GGS26DRAFT_589485 [Hypomontagnella submonticulosa]